MAIDPARLAAVLLSLLLSAPAAAAAPRPAPTVTPQVARLKDGSTLLLLRMPGAQEASLRWVVASGALRDPEGRAGLAHVVEHLVFHGSYETRWVQLGHAVREAGGALNAFTMGAATMYVLDAPRPAFVALAGRYLRTVTNPALTLASLETELGVIQSESELRPSATSIHAQIEMMLFPGLDQATTVIGRTASRKAISPRDVVDFYARHYTAGNTWAVVAGDLELEEARRLVEDNSCLPPEAGALGFESAAAKPRLPIDLQIRALATVVVFGYVLDGGTPLECQTAADVLERRLASELIVKDPLVSGIEVRCPRYRGTPVLEAIAFSTSTGLEVSRVPEVIESQFASLAKAPASREELRAAARRREALRSQLLESPSMLGQAAAMEIVQGERDASKALDWILPKGSASGPACRALAERSFTEERKISILFSPYHGDY